MTVFPKNYTGKLFFKKKRNKNKVIPSVFHNLPMQQSMQNLFFLIL